jgi:hypothetical protein
MHTIDGQAPARACMDLCATAQHITSYVSRAVHTRTRHASPQAPDHVQHSVSRDDAKARLEVNRPARSERSGAHR